MPQRKTLTKAQRLKDLEAKNKEVKDATLPPAEQVTLPSLAPSYTAPEPAPMAAPVQAPSKPQAYREDPEAAAEERRMERESKALRDQRDAEARKSPWTDAEANSAD